MIQRESIVKALRRELHKTRVSILRDEARDYDFVFLYENSSVENLAEIRALVSKIGESLGLPVSRWTSVEIRDWNLEGLSRASFQKKSRFVVLLGRPISGLQVHGAELILAESPFELLRSREKKAQLWESLKRALTQL